MKFFPFLLKNIFRNKRRTLLTMTSIAVSLFLVATLLTVLSELENPPMAPDSALRLVSRHKVSLANILPLSYRQKIQQVDDVEAAVGAAWVQGIYEDPANIFAQMAVQSDQIWKVLSDVKIPEDQKQAFLKDRTGCVAGKKLAARYKWKIGEKIVLKKGLWPADFELTLRGIYEAQDESGLYFQWDYFNEAMNNQGIVGWYWIKAKSAEAVPRVAQKVDAMFQNTTAPTKTESEKAFVLGFISMMGNVQLMIQTICSVVVFAIILVAANTMAMSIRERTREIGILKALGFRRRRILGLLVGEAVFITFLGAVIGSVGARLVFSQVIDMAELSSGFMQRFLVTGETLLICIVTGIFIGVVASMIPALQAARRPVVDALRRVV